MQVFYEKDVARDDTEASKKWARTARICPDRIEAKLRERAMNGAVL